MYLIEKQMDELIERLEPGPLKNQCVEGKEAFLGFRRVWGSTPESSGSFKGVVHQAQFRGDTSRICEFFKQSFMQLWDTHRHADQLNGVLNELLTEKRRNAELQDHLVESQVKLKEVKVQRDLLKQKCEETQSQLDQLGDVWSKTIRRVSGQPLFPFMRVVNELWRPVADHLSHSLQFNQVLGNLRHQIEIAYWHIEDLESQNRGLGRVASAIDHMRAQVKRFYRENQELRRRLRVGGIVDDLMLADRHRLGKALKRFQHFMTDYAFRPVDKMGYEEVVTFRGELRAQILAWADRIRTEDEKAKEEAVERR